MKNSLKTFGLIVGNVEDHYLVYSDDWGVYVEQPYATNKFKAALMELIGDLPDPYECYHYTVREKGEVLADRVTYWPDPYEQWKRAKDCAVHTPVALSIWPRKYCIVQRKSNLGFMAVRENLIAAISVRELDETVEHMPDRPSVLDGVVLYYKNETMIYWVHTEPAGQKAEDVLFPHLRGISFFENDWLEKEVRREMKKEGPADEPLPY